MWVDTSGMGITEFAAEPEGMIPTSPRQGVAPGRQWADVAEIAARPDDMIGEQHRTDIHGISVDLRKKFKCFVFHARRFDGRRPIQRGRAIAESELVEQRWSQRRSKVQCPDDRFFPDFSSVSRRPRSKVVVIRVVTFIDPRPTEPMLRIEVMIDLDVELVPAERVQNLRGAARTARDGAAHPAIDSHIQAIDR